MFNSVNKFSRAWLVKLNIRAKKSYYKKKKKIFNISKIKKYDLKRVSIEKLVLYINIFLFFNLFKLKNKIENASAVLVFK